MRRSLYGVYAEHLRNCNQCTAALRCAELRDQLAGHCEEGRHLADLICEGAAKLATGAARAVMPPVAVTAAGGWHCAACGGAIHASATDCPRLAAATAGSDGKGGAR